MVNSVVYAFIAAIVAVGALASSHAFAQDEAMSPPEGAVIQLPVMIQADTDVYTYGSDIVVTGNVANVRPGGIIDVTITVINPLNEIVELRQITPDSDGDFAFILSAQGDRWRYDGIYTIRAQYGEPLVYNEQIILTGDGEADLSTICSTMETIELCIQYSLSNGTLLGFELSEDGSSILLHIDSEDGGVATLYVDKSILGDVISVFLNGDMEDNVLLATDKIVIPFTDGTSEITIQGTSTAPMDPIEPVEPTPQVCAVLDDEEACITYVVTGSTVTGLTVNQDDSSLVFQIDAIEDGQVTFYIPEDILSDASLVFVDGEEWDDVYITGDMIIVEFLAGATEIEIFGASVIPEFGTIAVMILAIAIVSIIVLSTRTRLGMTLQH